MRAINNALEALPLAERVEDAPSGLLRCDVLIGGLDSKLARMRMNRIATRLGRPIVDAGLRRQGMLGRITVCDASRGTACLECGWDAAQRRDLARRTPCLNKDPVAPATDAPSELGGVVAAYQVIECRKLLASGTDALVSAYQILIDLVHHRAKVSVLPRNPDCRCNHQPWQIRPFHVDPIQTTLGDFLEFASNEDAGGPVTLGMYGKVFVLGLTCPDCGKRRRMARLHHRLSDRQKSCPRCSSQKGRKMTAGADDVVERIGAETHPGLLDRSLGNLGFRPHDVVTVQRATGHIHYEFFPEPTLGKDDRPNVS